MEIHPEPETRDYDGRFDGSPHIGPLMLIAGTTEVAGVLIGPLDVRSGAHVIIRGQFIGPLDIYQGGKATISRRGSVTGPINNGGVCINNGTHTGPVHGRAFEDEAL